jgi:integrase
MEAWVADMTSRRLSDHHVNLSRDSVVNVLDEMGAAYWNDLSKDAIRAALEARAERRGVAAGTFNRWLVSLRLFIRWCMDQGRAATDPTIGIKRRSQRADRRYIRRPLSPDELRRLIASANASTVAKMRLSGRERALLYLVAASTGWRWIELRRLQRMDFYLDEDPPMIAPPGWTQKSGRDDRLPLRADVAELLRAYFADNPAKPDALAFPMPTGRTGAPLLRFDLGNTGDTPDVAEAKRERGEVPLEAIPYKDERGRVADFHSLRHALATMIGRAGIQVKLAQGIMRHTDPALTIGVYTHAEDRERAAALEALPALVPAPSAPVADASDVAAFSPETGPEKRPESGASHGARSNEKVRDLAENRAPDEPDGDPLTFAGTLGKVPVYGLSGPDGDEPTITETHRSPCLRDEPERLPTPLVQFSRQR